MYPGWWKVYTMVGRGIHLGYTSVSRKRASFDPPDNKVKTPTQGPCKPLISLKTALFSGCEKVRIWWFQGAEIRGFEKRLILGIYQK